MNNLNLPDADRRAPTIGEQPPRWTYRQPSGWRRADDQREGVDRSLSDFFDAGAYSGEIATLPAAARERTILTLRGLLHRFQTIGFSHGVGQQHKISRSSEEAANAILACLPENRSLPTISPDDEAGVIMAWKSNTKTVLLTVDSWTLHLVRAPASSNSDYIDDVFFDGDTLPNEVVAAIPIE